MKMKHEINIASADAAPAAAFVFTTVFTVVATVAAAEAAAVAAALAAAPAAASVSEIILLPFIFLCHEVAKDSFLDQPRV